MGPPKKLPKKIAYSEYLYQNDFFVYKWDETTESYYLFNPYTGETILHTDIYSIDRSLSYWKPIDKYMSTKNMQTITLYKQPYASRTLGFRSFIKYSDKDEAATVINSAARGCIARLNLRKYYQSRYNKILQSNSGYYYFQDNYDDNKETSWYKPRLAFPDDIPVFTANDSEDYMKGDKYSYHSCLDGPYIRLSKIGKSNKIRAQHSTFIRPNPFRDIAVSKHEDIDLDIFPIGSVISWLEDYKVVPITIDEYAVIRSAESKSDWSNILKYMRQDPHNLTLQLFGFYSFSKLNVPIDFSGLLSTEATEVLYLCINYLDDIHNEYSQSLKLFVFYALYNILSTTAGRAEYFNVMSILEIGEARNIAIEQFITSKIMIFNKFLTKISIELQSIPTEKANVYVDVKRPTRRGAELVEQTLCCLCALANNSEYREQMAYITSTATIFALKLCEEEATVMIQGFKYLYNLCYRCESGQDLLHRRNVKSVIISAHTHHGGDKDVMYQCHRFELAMKQNGWRGYIEEVLTKEMLGEDIHEYLNPIEEKDDESQYSNPLNHILSNNLATNTNSNNNFENEMKTEVSSNSDDSEDQFFADI